MNELKSEKNGDLTKVDEKRVAVRKASRRLPTSYANVFQARIMDNMICVSYGLSYAESLEGEQVLTVDLERRLVMSPEAAARLAQALNRIVAKSREENSEELKPSAE